jgi:hypothetical protein
MTKQLALLLLSASLLIGVACSSQDDSEGRWLYKFNEVAQVVSEAAPPVAEVAMAVAACETYSECEAALAEAKPVLANYSDLVMAQANRLRVLEPPTKRTLAVQEAYLDVLQTQAVWVNQLRVCYVSLDETDCAEADRLQVEANGVWKRASELRQALNEELVP